MTSISNNMEITLSLDPYEHALLNEFSAVFAKPLDGDVDSNGDNSATTIQDVFSRWMWYRKVADNFKDMQKPVPFEDWDGDAEKGFQLFLHFLHYFAFDLLYFRTTTLQVDNPDFVHQLRNALKLETQPIKLDISSTPSDQKYWQMLADMVCDNEIGVADSDDLPFIEVMARMRPPINVRLNGSDSESGGAEDWVTEDSDDDDGRDEGCDEDKGNQGLAIEGEQRGEKKEQKDDIGRSVPQIEVDHEDMDDPYIPFHVWSLVRKSSILRRRGDNASLVLKCLDELEFFSFYAQITNDLYSRSPEPQVWLSGIVGQITHIGLVGQMARYGVDGYFVIEDPRQFVEYIPWEELSVSTGSENEPACALWNPQKIPLHHDHHLFTEEEVYRFCVTNHYAFPGHFQDGKVFFKMTSLKDSKFIEDIHLFWLKWSDCAITQDLISSDWILLETLPGQKFRQLWDTQDRLAALNYFRGIVNGILYGNPVSLADALQLNFRPEYENLLSLIPFDQFLIPEQDPMRGSRGIVYRAIWKCPRKIGMSALNDRDVVLKAIIPTSQNEQNAIFRELDVSFKALQGITTSVADLYGVTNAPNPLPDGCVLPLELTGAIFIVTECALEGSALEYIRKRLEGSVYDWRLILRFIMELASGLNVLHERNVLHRDLHWGNVLMTSRENRKDLLHSVQSKSLDDTASILITDLGEGKVIGSTSTIGRVYGNKEGRAPEVERYGNEAYSSAADMYSLGVLANRLVIEYWEVAESRGDKRRMISQTLWDLIERLRSPNPVDRPSARHVTREMERVWSSGTKGYDFEPNDLDLVEYHEHKERAEAVDVDIPF